MKRIERSRLGNRTVEKMYSCLRQPCSPVLSGKTGGDDIRGGDGVAEDGSLSTTSNYERVEVESGATRADVQGPSSDHGAELRGRREEA